MGAMNEKSGENLTIKSAADLAAIKKNTWPAAASTNGRCWCAEARAASPPTART